LRNAGAVRGADFVRAAGLALLFGLGLINPAAAEQTRTVVLYFPGEDGQFLKSEEREIEQTAPLSDQAGKIMLALLRGPDSRGALSLFGTQAKLRQVFIDSSGLAFVDLDKSTVERRKVGLTGERLSLWAIVNSICLNIQEIRAVKILIGGAEVPTFMGHVDITRPLYPDASLIKPEFSKENSRE